MKVIIIEGPDNCGKDTLISRLSKDFHNVIILHAGVPNSKDLFNYYYRGLIHDTLDCYYSNDVVIHNRSIYGEYVYGPKYRNESKEYVAGLINKLEVGQLRTFILNKDICLILLTSSNVDLLSNNDDGLSLSSEKNDIQDEINSFNEVFDLSIIENKKKIFVNNGNQFKDKEDIYKEVKDFIDNV